MKILLINGSPRKNGNSFTALKAIERGIKLNLQSEYEFINAYDLKVAPCVNCDFCKEHNGVCVHKDDSNSFMDKVIAADVIIITTPVYWWGISAQLKLLIDKFYSRDAMLHEQKKQLGILAVGAAELDDPQYRIISEQFANITNFLGWEFIFSESVSAWAADDLNKNSERLNEIEFLWNTVSV